MSTPGAYVAITDAQTEALAPTTGVLDFVHVYNPTAAVAYLNVWSSTPGQGDRPAANRVGGPWPVAAGQSIPVLIGCRHAGAVRLSATTATDGTGAPTAAVQCVPAWEG